MSDKAVSALDDLGLFFAHAHALETEAMERHAELADVMAVHNNDAAAEIFRKLSGYGAQHAEEVASLMKDVDAPRLAPWDYDWGGAEPLESSPMAEADYLMTAGRALRMALATERRARDYYRGVARDARDAEVRAYALTFAEEEAEHVSYVEAWIARMPDDPDTPITADDPPNTPE